MLGFGYLDYARGNDRAEWSNIQRHKAERKAKHILDKSYRVAKKIIKQHIPLLNELLILLMDKTIIVAEESNTIFEKYEM